MLFSYNRDNKFRVTGNSYAFSVSVPALQWKSYSNNTYVFRRSNTGRCSTKHKDRGCMPDPGEPVPAPGVAQRGAASPLPRGWICPHGGGSAADSHVATAHPGGYKALTVPPAHAPQRSPPLYGGSGTAPAPSPAPSARRSSARAAPREPR